MNPLLKFWLKNNYHLNERDAKDFGIENLSERVKELRAIGVIIHHEVRTDLNEIELRYWLDEKYR